MLISSEQGNQSKMFGLLRVMVNETTGFRSLAYTPHLIKTDAHRNRRNASHHIVPHRTASHRIASHRAWVIRGNPKVARGNPESSKTLVGGRETSYPTGGHPKINDLTNRLRLGKRKLPNFSFFFLLSLFLSLFLSRSLKSRLCTPRRAARVRNSPHGTERNGTEREAGRVRERAYCRVREPGADSRIPPFANYYASFDHWPTQIPYDFAEARRRVSFLLPCSYIAWRVQPYTLQHHSRLIITARGSSIRLR
ncbi:hypothetical protein ALC57_16333 [Trachymyrmex cornetzi]|uniref:Uncharacterized protein n=1 Tax=Trachymyrmex cornetzi TaxID=471704 RepID=A0A195DGF6_9HYME|nr:hypothetical protein ALC57_16333 [Trachymyrmex cornetzi]